MMNKCLIGAVLIWTAISGCTKSEIKSDQPVVVREQIVELSTSFGNMYIWLYKQTPLHRQNFIKLADSGFYNGTTFHRIVPDFVIQGGDPNSKDNDPNNDGQGGPGYTIPAEFVDSLKNIRGSVATARLSDGVNPTKASSGSQFYINMKHNTNLDKNYTVFGIVMKGIEIADQIVAQPRNTSTNRPLTNINMQVKILYKSAVEIKNEYGFTIPQ